MGILNTVGEIAGAIAAVEATEKVDPDASLLTKGLAAVAGFEGASALEKRLEKKDDEQADDAAAQPATDASPDQSADPQA